MDHQKKVGEKSRLKRQLEREDEEPEKRGASEKRKKQGASFDQSIPGLPTSFQRQQHSRQQGFPVQRVGTSQQQHHHQQGDYHQKQVDWLGEGEEGSTQAMMQGQQQQQQLAGSGVISQMMQGQRQQYAGGGLSQPTMQQEQQQQMLQSQDSSSESSEPTSSSDMSGLFVDESESSETEGSSSESSEPTSPPDVSDVSTPVEGTSFRRSMPRTVGQQEGEEDEEEEEEEEEEEVEVNQLQNQPPQQPSQQPSDQPQQLNAPLNPQQKQLRPITIWKGIMVIPELNQQRQIECQVTTTKNETLQDLLPQHWPRRMIMNIYHASIFNSITKLINISSRATFRTVTFQFLTENIQSITMLWDLVTTGRPATAATKFAIVQLVGTQNIPQCPIKTLFLFWNEKWKEFTGLIPLDQNKFVDVLIKVLFPYHHQQWPQLQQQQQQQQQQQPQQQQQQLAGGGEGEFSLSMMERQLLQQQNMNRQAQMEKLMHILQMLARGNPQQQEQILQRMPHLSAEQKQQLLQRAQAMKQQMIQQQQQQQAQSTQQGFPGGGPGNMMGDNQSSGPSSPATAGPSGGAEDAGMDASVNTSPHVQTPAPLPAQGRTPNPGTAMSPSSTPRLVIVKQPMSRGHRFRCDSERQIRGGLLGENSEKNPRQRTYPTVRLVGCRGQARVMVSVVTDTDPPMPHAYSLVGQNARDGRCLVEVGVETEMYAQFDNIDILRVTKKKVPEVLYKRLLQALKLRDNKLSWENIDRDLEWGFSDDKLSQVEREAASMAKTMNLSVVRLCFQAYLMDEHGSFTIPVDPVFSHEIYDSSTGSSHVLRESVKEILEPASSSSSSLVATTSEPPTQQMGMQQPEMSTEQLVEGFPDSPPPVGPPQPQHEEDMFGRSPSPTPNVQPDEIDQEEAKNLLYEAIEKGFVTSQHVVIILVGIAGSGKSSFKRVVLNLPLEEMRVSTPLAEATIRNISMSRATISDSDSIVWEVVGSEKLHEMVAGAVKEVGMPQDPTTEPTSAASLSSSPGPTVVTVAEEESQVCDLPSTSAASLSSSPNPTVVSVAEEESGPCDLPSTPVAPQLSSPSATVVSLVKKESGLHDLPSTAAASLSSSENPTVTDVTEEESRSRDLQAIQDDCEVRSKAGGNPAALEHDEDLDFKDDPLLPLISKSKGNRRLFRVHWVYIIDTGGQPQFLQLLPAFIKNISSCVCLLRLDQDLDHKPLVKYFDQSGKQCGESYPSEHTNLQIIESCVRTIHSRCCLNSEKPPGCFIVGTHLDEYEKKIKAGDSIEKIEEKNSRLLKKLSNPQLEQSLAFYRSGDDNERLIFPLNCKNPEERDRNVAAEFRKCVMNRCSESESKIPLAWFVLEERIRQYALKKKVAYVERATCAKIASQLHMSNKIFEAALNHLLKLNIFCCYSSLPNLIFCDTQVVLFKLTELVQYSFQLKRAVIYGILGEDISFKNEGIISVQFLRRFSTHYSELFTAECFLKILRELLAVADMQGQKCFMPCLLNELSEKEVSKHRSSSPSLSALLILLEGGCLPNGLFTSLVASLNNDLGWKLAYGGQHRKPICLYQNCVSFMVPGKLPGTVTLIASFKYLEVHVKCPIQSKINNICRRVYLDVKSGLKASWRVLYPGEVSFSLAFFCSSCPGSVSTESCKQHHADICEEEEFEMCSNDPSCGSSLSEPKLCWLRNARDISTQSIDIIDPVSTIAQELCESTSEFQRYLSQLPVSTFRYLNLPLDWDNEYDSDLIEIAMHLLRWEELLVRPFKFSRPDTHAIKAANQDSPELQRREVLRKWQDKFGLDATYKCLLEILVTSQHIEGAKAVCNVLRRRGLGKHPSGAQGKDLPPSKQSKQQ